MIKGMWPMFIVMLLSILVASLWTSLPVVRDTVHLVLNPTAGVLLDWNVTIGLMIVTALITLVTTLLQKYLTDQGQLKVIKDEQKSLQQQMKLSKSDPQKSMELTKKSMELTMQMMPMTMKPLMYTVVPFVLFLRWFQDYFTTAGNPHILGFMSWFWAYLIFSLIFSSIFRKVLKVH